MLAKNTMWSLLRSCWCVLRSILVIINNLYCIPTYVLWMIIFLPLKFFHEDLYWKIEGRIFHWLLAMVSLWSYLAGYDIIETGDLLDDIVNDECLVLVNHQSTSDVPLLMAAFNTRKGLLPNLTWIMDAIFKYTNFGIVSVIHGDFFIYAGKEKREASLVELSSYLNEVYIPRKRKWIVLFPEGGFLRKRKATSQRYAAKNNLPVLHHVTLPRMGAMQAIMNNIAYKPLKSLNEESIIPNNNYEPMPGQLKYVLDVTIAYPQGNPLDLGAVISSYARPCSIRFHYRLYPISAVPKDSNKLQDWLNERYLEKEANLAEYYTTGYWKWVEGKTKRLSGVTKTTGNEPKEPSKQEELLVQQDLLRGILLHFLFLSSTYFHYKLISSFIMSISSLFC